MSGAESVLKQKRQNARDKEQAQRLRLQQDSRAVSVLRDRNMASQRSHQKSLL